jgi:hypothetical protein
MSKFDFQSFSGETGKFAVNSEKYSKEQSIAIFERETGCHVGNGMDDYSVSTAWVRHRAGHNKDSEPCVGWWLEYEQHSCSCHVWEFHRAMYDWECRVCGCTWFHACPGGCYWVEPGLCSRCAEKI